MQAGIGFRRGWAVPWCAGADFKRRPLLRLARFLRLTFCAVCGATAPQTTGEE